jgi:hypothetical protein
MGAKNTGFGAVSGPMANGSHSFFGCAMDENICTLNRRHKAIAYSLAKSMGCASAAVQYP